jgi:ATP:ADP antiporter, AAA family
VVGLRVHWAKQQQAASATIKKWRGALDDGYAGPMETLIKKLVNAKSGEIKAILWSFLYFFCLLSAYYILRPLRDEMAVIGDTRKLNWMFTATFVALLATAPLLAAVVAKLPRPRFIPVVYLFFVANLLLFWVLLKSEWQTVYVARAFFVWIAVFSVFTVSVFWSFMSDLYSTEQSKRLFAFIAAGGSIGTLVGPLLAKELAVPLGPANLLLIAAVLLTLAVICANRLEGAAAEVRAATPGFEAASARREKEPVGGGVFEGFLWLFKSAYLGSIAVWVFLLSLLGTFVYLKYVAAVGASSTDSAVRTATFASVDLWIGVLSLALQFLVSGRIISKLGTGWAAAVLPAIFVVGFIVMAVHPVFMVLLGLQVVSRTANFGVSNVARESLFTAVSREERFKAKNIIDGAVFRGADALNAWIFTAATAVLAAPVFAIASSVIGVGYVLLSLGLGREQERRAARQGGG